jgi:hypothetical protein
VRLSTCLQTPLPQLLAEPGGRLWHGNLQLLPPSAESALHVACGSLAGADKTIDAVSRFLLRHGNATCAAGRTGETDSLEAVPKREAPGHSDQLFLRCKPLHPGATLRHWLPRRGIGARVSRNALCRIFAPGHSHCDGLRRHPSANTFPRARRSSSSPGQQALKPRSMDLMRRPDHHPPGALLVHCASAMGLGFGTVVIPDAETEAAADSIAAVLRLTCVPRSPAPASGAGPRSAGQPVATPTGAVRGRP